MPAFVSKDGVRLHYEVEGDGPPVVLHLGAGCDADLWRAAGYVEPLARSYACVLYDHRGHGQSDHPTSVEANHIDRYADDLAALVSHLGAPRASIFGWSNAIQVGLKAADTHPGLFESLVLFGAIPPYRTREQLEAGNPERVAGLERDGWWYVIGDMIESEKFAVPRWFVDRVLATDFEPYLAWNRARPDWGWSPWDAMPRVKAPTLYLAGELEDPDDLLAEAARITPNATRLRIPDREHINAFLYSEYVVPRVLDFLAARTPQASG